jgi:hypothetical protein
MKNQEVSVALEEVSGRMVLGRMVLGIEDANPFHTGDGSEGFYLSKSRLNRYISCPRSYFIHYELGISPLRPDTDRLIGLSTHRLIAAHHLARKKDEFVDPNVMLDDFWSRHAREGDDAAIHQEMKAARNDSLRYAELFIREAPLDPLEIERAFTVPLVNLDNGDIRSPGLEETRGALEEGLKGPAQVLEFKTVKAV